MQKYSNKPLDDKNMSLEERVRGLEAKVGKSGKLKKNKNSKKHSLKSFTKEYISYLKSYSTPKYIKSVELTLNHLTDILGSKKDITEITLEDANNVINELEERAPKGFRVYYRNLRAAFNYAKSKPRKYIKANPFERVKLRKQQKVAPAYIVESQLNLILDKMKNEDLKEIVYFAFYTGCRKNEILNLRWTDIDFKNEMVTIGSEAFDTKTKTQRKVPIPKKLLTRLWIRKFTRRKNASKPDSLVFAKPNGFSFHEDVPTKAFKAACRLAGIDEKVHFHSLRHSFASHHVSRGTQLYKVRDLLGHSSVKTTEIYSHLDEKSIKETVKVFDDK